MRYHRLSVTQLTTLSTSYHDTLWSAGIATLKIPTASYTMHDPRVWLLHTNRQQLSELLEQAFRDRYASYTEEAVPLLKQALLVRVFGFAHPTHKGASLLRCQRLCWRHRFVARLVSQLTRVNAAILGAALVLVIVPITVRVRKLTVVSVLSALIE
jgi:hypothetical protein